ncbi:aminotransferase class V-fold PLP-dependent enzyme [Acetobacterium bakii]|uniref:cysteine desulfurase n=1 Tax=Acetobacterium bakii TaxID=52689 RepID=A0A0L6U0K8_9FIRM|nr:aminotransferase class V-fold PLP-dependent enzyme [Acetobacterium bakii]KNZ41862.1 cysteine desulfurase [Acetobacterium bakii]
MLKNRIYLDHACTSFPKPEGMALAIVDYIEKNGTNINRGGYQDAYDTAEMVFETREMLSQMFNCPDCKNVIFTPNVTTSLNIILKGYLKPGDHVLVSSMEHNAVMRPLTQLKQSGVAFDRIPCSTKGELLFEELQKHLKPNTKAIVMTHASNVCGTVLPIERVGLFCQENGLDFIVDAAQTAGVLPIDMNAMGIDALAFTGHKSLLGPQGIGGFILKEAMIEKIEPLLSGGTGSISHTEEIPDFMPDRFEPGTMNLPGIVGLNASLKYLMDVRIQTIYEKEMMLTSLLLEELSHLPEIKIVGMPNAVNRTAVVSVQALNHDLAGIAFRLDCEYGIMTRVGLHCSPSAHETLQTYPTGTLRFSLGHGNTKEEIHYVADALRKILNGI